MEYVDPIPDQASLSRYYEYEAYGRVTYDRGERPTEARIGDLVRLLESARSHGMPPGRLLDVGCSTGQMLTAARRAGWSPEGIEIDPRTVQVAQERTGARVRVGTGLEALAPGERFEAITMSHWLEHSPEPRRQLALARESLVPGGALLIRVPNSEGDAARLLGRGWMWFSPPVHLFYLSATALRCVAQQIGLEPTWTIVRQGDAWCLPVELALGYARRFKPRARASSEPRASASPVFEVRAMRTFSRIAEVLSAASPLRRWEDSELVMLLRRPQPP